MAYVSSDIYGLSERSIMSVEMMNTTEVERYLGLHEKQVHALIKDRKIPATMFTGKRVFLNKLIDEWGEIRAGLGLKG